VGNEENMINLEPQEVLTVLKHLDQGLAQTSGLVAIIALDLKQNSWNQDESSRALEHQLEKLSRDVGSKPRALLVEYNALTVWGSIGAMGSG
jgi:hypothetical protein